MDFRKTSIPVVCPQIPETLTELQRKFSPHSKGGFEVIFVDVDSDEISKSCLDPRVITLEYCIQNNVFIDPTDAQHILNISDPADLEDVASRVSEDAYSWIMKNEPNFNYEKNTIVETSKES